jgi:predicted AAA+ superfamily ATPase
MRDDDEVRSTYLNGILSTIILRDILMRFSVRNQAILIDIFRFFVDNIGSLISIRRITQFLKSQRLSISEDTLRDYTGYFEQTCLLSRVPRYDIRGKKLLEVNEKYYIADIGLRNAFL